MFVNQWVKVLVFVILAIVPGGFTAAGIYLYAKKAGWVDYITDKGKTLITIMKEVEYV